MLDRPFDPDTRIVAKATSEAILERECDICVVGSGASGASAAIEAARAGRSVILVDGLPTHRDVLRPIHLRPRWASAHSWHRRRDPA
jgi:choline dehydrogenase-like flavoprotein